MRNRAIARARRLLGTGALVVLAGCTAGPGGCGPTDGSGTTTTAPVGSPTTTTVLDETTTTEATTTTSSSTTTTEAPGPSEMLVDVDDLEVEDCLIPATDEVMVAQVEIVDCEQPHAMEVFAQFELDREALPGSGDDYPGGNELTWYAQDECQDRFDAYTGHSYWTSPYDLRVLTPSFSTWDAGDRVITCLIVGRDGAPLTTGAKG